MCHSEKAATIPLWEKICILIVITVSVGSLYAVIHTYIDAGKNSEHLSLVSRKEWKAQPPTDFHIKLVILPPPYVIISHTDTEFCYTQAKCASIVRIAQTFHIESKGWKDIAYNFLIGGDGNIYEGRGWDFQGAHSTFLYNSKSIGISFIGTFNTDKPNKVQLEAAKKLLEFGVKNGKIAEDYKLLGHSQVFQTKSPGEVLFNIIKIWNHWSPN